MSEVRELLMSCGEPVSGALTRAERRLAGAEEMQKLVLDWATSMRVTRGMALNTIAGYIESVSQFMQWLAAKGKGLDYVTPTVVDEWQRDLYVRLKLAKPTRSFKLTAVKQFFQWREERGLGGNCIRGVRGPKKAYRVPKKYSHAQLAAMFKSCDRQTLRGKRDYALLMLFVCTGCRVSEAAGLELEQIELRERVGQVQFLGKGAKERLVSFEKPLIDALLDWLEAREKLPLTNRLRVFASLQPGHYGQPLGRNGIASIFADVKAAAKIDTRMHPHKFRVTFATEMYDQGHELEEIRILLGHEKIETTRGYLAVSERARRARLTSRQVKVMTGESRPQPLWVQQKLRDSGAGQPE